jgi:hypothetical protein
MGETMIDSDVRKFAEYLGCDPKLAQDLYFDLDVSLALDDENKGDVRRELEALTIVTSKLASARQTLESLPDHCNALRFTLQAEGTDLLASVMQLHQKAEEVVGFGKMKLTEETSGSRANLKADKIADFVAAVFLSTGRSVTFGTKPEDSSEPSTPFGRAVREALTIFKVYRKSDIPHLTPKPAHWKRPAERISRKSQKPN